MKLQKADKDMVRGYKKTKVMGIIDQFVASDMDCAEVQYEVGEYACPTSCYNSVKQAIRRCRCEDTVSAKTVNGVVYLYKKENSDDRD